MMKYEGIKYELVDTRDDVPTIVILLGGRKIPIHSRFHPSREAASMMEYFNPDKYNALIVLGVGLGYHLLPLKDKLDTYHTIVLIDAVAGIKDEIGQNSLTSFLASSEKIKFIEAGNPEEIEEFLQKELDFSIISGIHVIEHPVSVRSLDFYYNPARDAINKVINRKAGSSAAKRAFGNLYFRNVMKNLAGLGSCRPVSGIFGKFSGYGGLIVTSGPTLERLLPAIGRERRNFFIISVDSAAPVLVRNGITPDFIVSVDPQPYVHEHLSGINTEGVVRVLSLSSSPLAHSGGTVFMSLNSHPVSQLISQAFPGAIGSIDSLTGSVAGDALCLAFKLGLEPLCLAGFDFSFPEYKIYSRNTSYQERYSKFFGGRFLPIETQNLNYIMKSSRGFRFSGKFSRRAFMQYRESMEGFIGKCGIRGLMNINLSGISINGAADCLFEDFLKSCSAGGIPGRDGIINDAVAGADTIGSSIDMQVILGLLGDRKIFSELVNSSMEKVSERKREKLLMMAGGK